MRARELRVPTAAQAAAIRVTLAKCQSIFMYLLLPPALVIIFPAQPARRKSDSVQIVAELVRNDLSYKSIMKEVHTYNKGVRVEGTLRRLF